ncbi:MAG: hypothetical protein Q8N26_17730 [Myxococcales bacterium]|nr:hypothetical protein [Myxococcales bacterium]
MIVQVLVSQMEASAHTREWISRRLHEVLGAAVTGVLSIAVVLNPVTNERKAETKVRCSLVVTTAEGRRVVETRDAKAEAALERAMRLVSLSLFAEQPFVAVRSSEKPAPLT